MVSGELEKLLKRYITPDIVVKAGVLENATRGEGGTPVAEYAAYNEYGATIEIPERTQTLYFKRKRDGSVGNRFVKKGKSDFAQGSVGQSPHRHHPLPAFPALNARCQGRRMVR